MKASKLAAQPCFISKKHERHHLWGYYKEVADGPETKRTPMLAEKNQHQPGRPKKVNKHLGPAIGVVFTV